MRVHLGADHAGLDLKRHLLTWLRDNGHQPTDHGAFADDPEDDYPPFCLLAGQAVVGEPGSLGVVLGGSGNGEQIAANKVAGVRAALAWSVQTAELARLHNNANIVAIGARMHSTAEATRLVEVFLNTDFSGEERHVRRIGMISDYEESGRVVGAAPGADPSVGGPST
jgi:ribose 5-phosphate isomerase B